MTHGSRSDESRVATQAGWPSRHPHDWPLYVQTGGAVSFYQPPATAFSRFGADLTTLRVMNSVLGVDLIPTFYLRARQFVAAKAAVSTTALLSSAHSPPCRPLFSGRKGAHRYQTDPDRRVHSRFFGGARALDQDCARRRPPDIGQGRSGVTYIAVDSATQRFMPMLRRHIPGRLTEVVQPAMCSTFSPVAYTLPRKSP